MERIGGRNGTIIILLRNLLISYLVTGGSLLLLALLLYRFRLSEAVISIGIIVIYIASTFLGGFLSGKSMKNRKFLWGLLMGISYFLLMIIISLLVNHSLEDIGTNLLTVFLLCAGAGTLGGMLS